MNPPSDDLNKTKMVNNKTDMTTNLIPPSSIYPASQRTPMKVSFAYDASLKQALAITPGMAMQDNLDEDVTINFLRIVKKGGSDGTTVGPTFSKHSPSKGKSQSCQPRKHDYVQHVHPKGISNKPILQSLFWSGFQEAAQTSTQILESL